MLNCLKERKEEFQTIFLLHRVILAEIYISFLRIFFFSTSKMFNTMLRDISKSYSLHVWLKLSRNTAVGPDMCIKIRASLVETRECNYLAPRRTVLWKKWIKQNELNVQRYARTMGFSSDTKVIFIENTQLLKYLKRRKKEKIQTTR